MNHKPTTDELSPSGPLAAEFAPGGVLRAAINYGNPVLAQKGADGEPAGVSAALARELARRLGVPVAFETFDTAGAVVDALGSEKTWDVAFLAIDPKRAQTIAFTPPYVLIEGFYLVRDDSPIVGNADVDRPGVRLSVGRDTAYDLYLARHLKAAERVFSPTSQAAMSQFLERRLDALAGVRQPLDAFARKHAGLRLLPERFMAIEQAVAIPRGRPAAFDYARAFIEAAKASGFVAQALAASGQGDAAVAPPAARP